MTFVSTRTLVERFEEKIDFEGPVMPGMETPCWVWTASTNPKGYGTFRSVSKQNPRAAHRVAYEILVGEVPEGLQLDHLCRNRPCVRPDHLEPVTGRENTLRGESPSAQAARKTHCPQGHPYDEENTMRSGGVRYCKACKKGRLERDNETRRARRAKAKAS